MIMIVLLIRTMKIHVLKRRFKSKVKTVVARDMYKVMV